MHVYTASLNQFTKNLACEWGKDSIRVNAVSPWYTRTPLVEAVLCPTRNPGFQSKVEEATPLGRIGPIMGRH
jgi:Tropinone reductase 1